MKRLSRRTLLRAAGTCLGLPCLDAMLPLTAIAARNRETPPIRLVCLGLEGGLWAGDDGFFPWKAGTDLKRAMQWGRKGILPGGAIADVGPNFALTQTLQPLEPVRDQLLLLSGLHHRNDKIPNTVVNGHGQDLGTLLTGANISGTPGVSLKNAISFDQLLAARIGDATREPSLQLAASGKSYNTREATGLGYMGFLSYDADGYAMPVEWKAQELFDRLFTLGTKKQRAARLRDRERNRSILDAVLEDATALEKKVSVSDRGKLDQYFSTVREVERRMQRAEDWEKQPVNLPKNTSRPAKSRGGVYAGDGSERIEQMQQMLDVLVLSLQTDVTRIATMRLGGYRGRFKFLGFPEDPHGVYAHNGGEPEKVAGAKAIDRMHMEQVAYLLTKMQAIEETQGTLLENSMVFCGAGLTNGPSEKTRGKEIRYNAHGQANTPILVAGGGGGALPTGQHLNFDHGTPLANLYVSLAQVMGVPNLRIADSTGPLAGLV